MAGKSNATAGGGGGGAIATNTPYSIGGGSSSSTGDFVQWNMGSGYNYPGYYPNTIPNPNTTYPYTGGTVNPNAALEMKLDQLIALMMQMTQRLEDLVAILES